MPAYNEAATIGDVLGALKALEYELEIIVVDDGSDDQTAAIVTAAVGRDERITLVAHEHRRGKGAAVRTALARCTGTVVIIQDADAEYDPSDIPRLVNLILAGTADAVYGSRLRGGQPQRAHLFWHYAGNRLLSMLTGILFNTTLSDMEVGYKAIRGDIARGLTLVSEDFRIEPEITARLVQKGSNFESLLCGLSPPVSPRPRKAHGYTFGPSPYSGLRQRIREKRKFGSASV